MSFRIDGRREGRNDMDNNADERWLSRQELADRYGLPVKTPAQWASKGTGPRYARIGRHVRYRLSDVIAWEEQRFESHAPRAARPGVATTPKPEADAGTTAPQAEGDALKRWPQ
jgi:predicted DNA-binding transcriptional regulator AlpA